MIQGINRERLYQDEHNRDNNLIISSSLHHSWFQFFTLVLYFSALCLVLGMTSLTHTSDVLISWRFEKSVLKKKNLILLVLLLITYKKDLYERMILRIYM